MPAKKPPIAPENLKWRSIHLHKNEATLWQLGNLKIYAQRIQSDWMLARCNSVAPHPSHSHDTVTSLSWIPLDVEWKRWVLDKDTDTIRFWPIFPDKPILVKTRTTMIVPPASVIDLFVSLPIWLEVSVAQNNDFYRLDTIAPHTLSNTWYGNHFEGQLCYALKSCARRNIEDLTDTPLHAVCSCRIQNHSKESLPIEKIRIQPAYLSLYQAGNNLWTSKLTVTFKEGNPHADVHYSKSPPSHLENPSLLRKADKNERKESLIDKIQFYTHRSEYQ